MSNIVKIVLIAVGVVILIGAVFGAAWLGTSLAISGRADRGPALGPAPFAQPPIYYQRGYAPGMMGGTRGGLMGGPGLGWMADYRDEMETAIAEGLGLTEEEFEARLADGETPWQIAQDQGISAEDFRAILRDARASVIAQAVEDGVITQEQADRILSRMERGGFPVGPGWGDCPCVPEETPEDGN